MSNEMILLAGTAGTLGVVHTLLGPDHYIPFVMMSRVQKWSTRKTAFITVLCGIGHVTSSIVLGLIGIALGMAISKLEIVELSRGNLAAWSLVTFGFVYFVWGIRQAIKKRPHTHWHSHTDGIVHDHTHGHTAQHAHVHTASEGANITPWILFTIFVFGPCEVLIPTLMYPAYEQSLWGVFLVVAVFATATLTTMLVTVGLLIWGANMIPLGKLDRYSHAFAGATICACGGAIIFLPI